MWLLIYHLPLLGAIPSRLVSMDCSFGIYHTVLSEIAVIWNSGGLE